MIFIMIILFVVATLMLIAELFLPGFGIFGIMGAILFCIALFVTANTYGLLYMFISILIIGFVLYTTTHIFKKNKIYNKIILNDCLNCYENDLKSNENLIGRKGIVINPLKPLGKADFDGDIIEVCSNNGYIVEGKFVEVTNIFDNNIIVKELKI